MIGLVLFAKSVLSFRKIRGFGELPNEHYIIPISGNSTAERLEVNKPRLV